MPLNWHQKATVGYPLLCYGKKKKSILTQVLAFSENVSGQLHFRHITCGKDRFGDVT